MKVVLRNPRRKLTLAGAMSVLKLLGQLDLHRESVLVIRESVDGGAPRRRHLCAFYRLVGRVAGHEPVPVEMVRKRRSA